jgi:hypothetical protein
MDLDFENLCSMYCHSLGAARLRRLCDEFPFAGQVGQCLGLGNGSFELRKGETLESFSPG